MKIVIEPNIFLNGDQLFDFLKKGWEISSSSSFKQELKKKSKEDLVYIICTLISQTQLK